MSLLSWVLIIFITLLSIRTLCAHLQSWQLREYRWDRMRGYLRTEQGLKNIFNLWFFDGFCPRPKITTRILLIIGLTVLLNTGVWFILSSFSLWIKLLILERLLWLTVALSVFISQIPVNIKRRQIFAQARKIIDEADQTIVKIGIAGSFGKSSTKNILVHLLIQIYGRENVLYTPENLNQELAIARLIIKNKAFFKPSSRPRIFVFETAAYARGEIKQIAEVARPHYALMTGLNTQHLETFGSLENTKKAKCELVEHTSRKAFYNADNALMCEGMKAVQTEAEKVPVSIHHPPLTIHPFVDRTEFVYQDQKYTLPWPGSFFVINALLCLELISELRNLGTKELRNEFSSSQVSEFLRLLPPQPKALQVETHPQGFTILRDLYSQNPDGTLHAIKHLAKAKGKRIMIGMPLLELAGESEQIHEQIFCSIKKHDITLYWTKDDHADLGRRILGNQFHLLKDPSLDLSGWSKNTTVLLEGRLPSSVLNLFS